MNPLKPAALSALSACLLLSLLTSPAAPKGQPVESLEWGAPVDGLQMSISAASLGKADAPAFQVAFRNVGGKDVTLNLGVMLANGRAQVPDRIMLNLMDANGRTRNLSFADRRHPGVAGRIDDYIVPLRSGSIHVLEISLGQFVSPETSEYELWLAPGRYRITARFEGGGARFSNLDRPGGKLMNFWQGRLQSNVLAVER